MGKLKLKVFNALCSTETFEINGIQADRGDFGSQYDAGAAYAEPYACGNMIFEPKPATSEILEKYKIDVDEYNDIATKLKDALSFGNCGWCV